MVSNDTAFGLTADDLGKMEDLDPDSWKNYNKFLKKDQEIDKKLEALYLVNKEMLEIAQKVYEEGKKQDVLTDSNRNAVERVKNKAIRANATIQGVQDAIEGKGSGKICIYIVLICLIIGVAYAIYTMANGEDPCSQYNSKECTGLSSSSSSSSNSRL